eukprot:10145903-Prorocentrum_lima.AAC.1
MAHTGQIDGLLDDSGEQEQEPSNRQEINMMKGLIHMIKQQLKQIKASQEEVETSLQHGLSNPASGGWKSVPVS